MIREQVVEQTAIDPPQFPIVIKPQRTYLFGLIGALACVLIIVYFVGQSPSGVSGHLATHASGFSASSSMLIFFFVVLAILLPQMTLQITLNENAFTLKDIMNSEVTYRLDEIEAVKISGRNSSSLTIIPLDKARKSVSFDTNLLSDSNKKIISEFFRSKITLGW